MKVYLVIVNFCYETSPFNEYDHGCMICDIFRNKEDAEKMCRRINENKDFLYHFNEIPFGSSIYAEVEERTVRESL